MSSVFNCSSVRMLVIVLSNKVWNTIAFTRYGVTAPVTLTTSLGASSSTVQNDDTMSDVDKKKEIYPCDVFFLWQDSEQEPILQLHC